MPVEVPSSPVSVEFEAEREEGREIREELARRFGTPAYLYEADELEARAGELQSALPVDRLLYSFKANPLPSVALHLRKQGCEADLTSPGELAAAREAGFDLSRALYGGPGKGVDEYTIAIGAGITCFSVESALDLERLAEAAQSAGKTVQALLRINPHTPPRAKLAMAGVASQFGFEEEELRLRGREIQRAAGRSVTLVGFHLYWGTQVADASSLLDSFETTLAIADSLAETAGFPLEILNLGGGFPWPYAHAGGGPDLSALRSGLEALRKESRPSARASWWFESGRYLTASSGTLLTRVMEVKRSKDDRLFLILDTGIHHLGGMAGLGRIPRFSVDLEVPAIRRDNPNLAVDVVGPLCTPLDCLAKKIELPAVEPGDLLAIPNVGAYGATASVGDFLSRPSAVEILHRRGEVIAVHRLRGGHESLL